MLSRVGLLGSRYTYSITGALQYAIHLSQPGCGIKCAERTLQRERSTYDSSRFQSSSASSKENTSILRVNRPHPSIDRIIRVNHAGELGADRIYAGQAAVLGNTEIGETIELMWKQEKEHVEIFEKMMSQRRVRPTMMQPLWHVAGFALGAGSALLGKEAAMACTVAVEDVISDHYNNQLRELLNEDIGDEELLQGIVKCRDDETEHMELGIEHNAEQAPMYEALTQAVKVGCKLAIWVSEKV